MKWKPQARRTPIGLDIGGWNIKAVQFSQTSKGYRIEAAACFERAMPNGPIDANELNRLCDILDRRGFTGSDVVLALPADLVLTTTMELPARVSAVSLDGIARTEFARAHKEPAGEFEMCYWDLPNPPRSNRATMVMAVGCTHKSADALVGNFVQAGLEVCGLDVRSWAMARACAPDCEGANGIVGMLDLGRNAAVLVAQYDGVIVYERTLEEASMKRLHETLMNGLRLTPEVAEYVMQENTVAEQGAAEAGAWDGAGEARSLIAAHIEAIGKDIQASIAYIGNQYPDAPIALMVVCGGGAMLPGLRKQLQAQLGLEVRLATPLAIGSGSPRILQECTPALTIAAGLALYPSP